MTWAYREITVAESSIRGSSDDGAPNTVLQPPGWPQQCTNTRTDAGPPGWPPVPVWPAGRPIPQWPRLAAGHSDDLAAGH